ncbi:MAG: DoxX family protein [Verrucomicrobia bacterium]|nr:DoxX family protein [Verrucomicrobiota bacterium]
MKTANVENQFSHDTALLLLRGITGAVFVFHGAQKLFGGLNGFAGYLASLGIPFPQLNAGLAAGVEFFGGLALIVGLRTSWAAIPLVATMLVACFALRNGGFDSQQGGMEFPLTLALVTAAIGLLGAGRFTLGHAVARLRSGSERIAERKPLLHEP